MKTVYKSLLLALLITFVPILSAQADPTVDNPVIMGPVTVTNLSFSSTPSVGGTTVTLTGSGFDSISRPLLVPAYGTTASTYTLTPTKTSTKYSFKFPDDIVAGTYTFQFITDGNYGRIYLANSYSYQVYYFTVGMGANSDRPFVSDISPDSTTIGSNVTVTGENFASQPDLYFTGDSLAQPLKLDATSTSNGTKIAFTVPDSLNSGTYYLSVAQPSGVSNQTYFNVSTTAPFTTAITPTSGAAGTEITITGGNFSGVNTVAIKSSTGIIDSENYLPSSNGGTTLKYITPTNLSPGVYTVSVTNLNGTSNSQTFTVGAPVSTEKHSEGTNVLGPDGTVYRIVGNSRQPYTSAGAFLSYKFNSWSTVVTASSGDLALPLSTYTPSGASAPVTYFIPPRNGSLINDNGTVYLITGGLRAGFVSEAAFKGMGYTYANVYPGDTSFMVSTDPISSVEQKHPNGTLINNNGTLYVMQNGSRSGFPSMAVLDSWGYWVTDAVPANSYDRQAAVGAVIQTRMANQMGI